MRPVRLTLTFLLMLVVLPWGAYARSHAVGGTGKAAELAQTLIDSAQPAIRSDSHDSAAATKRRCRGPALLGSVCGPDQVIFTTCTALPEAGLSSVIAPIPARRLVGRVPPTALDPPRFC